jgi:hypothetical protein
MKADSVVGSAVSCWLSEGESVEKTVLVLVCASGPSMGSAYKVISREHSFQHWESYPFLRGRLVLGTQSGFGIKR